MTEKTKNHYGDILTSIEEEGLYKKERVITISAKCKH